MKIDFKKIFKKKKVFKIKHQDFTPHRGWIRLVWFALMSGLFLIILSLYLFSQIKNDNLFKVEEVENTVPEAIDQDLLEKILSSSKEKEKNTMKILNREVFFTDPS